MVLTNVNVTSDPIFWLILIVAVIVALVIGGVVGAYCAYKIIPNNAKKQSANIIKEAESKGNQIVKSAQIDGRSIALELKVAAEKELGNEGRVLVRVSGTEPLVRVMLEGKDLDKINELGESVAQVVRERLV